MPATAASATARTTRASGLADLRCRLFTLALAVAACGTVSPDETVPTAPPASSEVTTGASVDGCGLDGALPENGWLGGEPGSGISLSLPEWAAVADADREADRLAVEAQNALNGGFEIVVAETYEQPACSEAPRLLRAWLDHPERGSVMIFATTLLQALDWATEPITAAAMPLRTDDNGSQVVTDLDADDARQRAWVATPQGRYIKVVAIAPNAPPEQFGVATTIFVDPDGPEPGEPPLDAEAAVALALELLG